MAGVAIFAVILLAGFIAHNAWVEDQVDDAELSFHRTTTSEERITHLATIFDPPGLFQTSDYDYKARQLFYDLSGEEQLSLFDTKGYGVTGKENDKLVIVIKGLYVTLADVDNTQHTDWHLLKMSKSLEPLDEPTLKKEIDHWLEARRLAKKGQHNDALDEYNAAINLNADNPATLYERARVEAELGQCELTFNDLDQVLAIAARLPVIPTPTPTLPITSTITPIGTIESNITSDKPPTLSTPLTNTPTSQAISRGLTPLSTPLSTGGPTPVEATESIDTVSTPTTPGPSPTPTLIPLPPKFNSRFVTTGEMIDAVSDLFDKCRVSASFLADTPGLYPNLEEFGLIPAPSAGTVAYTLRVMDEDTGEPISRAQVTIIVRGLAPLLEVTDSLGYAIFVIDAERSGQLGRLEVAARNYGLYTRNLNINPDVLPTTIRLQSESEPALISTTTTTPTTPPTTEPITPMVSITPTLNPTVSPSPSPTIVPPTGTIAYSVFDSANRTYSIHLRSWPNLDQVTVIPQAGQPAANPSDSTLAFRSWDTLGLVNWKVPLMDLFPQGRPVSKAGCMRG